MAYNPYSAVNAIYNLKGQWDDANNAGDTAQKDKIAAKAQVYYQQLRDNNYGDVADKLTASNHLQAKTINDAWAKMGKTATRPYLYSLGQKYGMSQSDVDNLIGWDNDSQQLIFGGKTVGTPDNVVDGVSYWGDTSVLDNAFNDYAKRSGTAINDSLLQSQHNTKISDKIDTLWGTQTKDHDEMNELYKKEYDSIKNTNPFTTEEAKAILGKYDLAGLQGRDNAVASGSSTNGGNIDSFSAANAMRQQASLTAQGQMAVLDAHQQKIDNARSILEGLGAYQQNSYAGMQNTIGVEQTEAQRLFDNSETKEQRVFENSETAKNNEVARLLEQANVTGYTPEQWTYSNNIYLNSDGTVKSSFMSEDFDNNGGFTTIINNAKEKLKTTTDATERANLEATIKQATQAKALKTLQNPAYAQYAHEISATAPTRTEAGKQFDETMKYNYDMLAAENAQKLMSGGGRVVASGSKVTTSGGSKTTTKPNLTAAQARTALENGVTTQEVIDAYNYWHGDGAANMYLGGLGTPDGTTAPQPVDTSNYTVTNESGGGFITITGFGRITPMELPVYLENGTIGESVDHDKKTIRYYKK